MILKDTDQIQVVTNAAVPVDVHASYFDYDGSVVTPDRQDTAITTATTTAVVGSPAANTKRKVKLLTIRNKDGALPVTVTVKHHNGTIGVEMRSEVLAAGGEMHYLESYGFLLL